MQTTTLKRLYLCELRQAYLTPESVTVMPGHHAQVCDYCYRWHAVPEHRDEAELLRFAASLVNFSNIVKQHPLPVV